MPLQNLLDEIEQAPHDDHERIGHKTENSRRDDLSDNQPVDDSEHLHGALPDRVVPRKSIPGILHRRRR